MAIARTTDPATSHEAAASVTGVRASQRDVLRTFAAWGPMTDEQLVARLSPIKPRDGRRPQSPSGIRTRRAELVAQGLVRDSGKRAVMTTGRNAIVWELVG